jgi:pSer/pThr/pTyr-binding forkhead associated (FHA) protein
MDDNSSPLGAPSLSLQKTTGPDSLLPVEFVPLILILLPRGVRLELTKPDMLMGRHSDMDVRLPLPDVSRRHCRFVFTRSGWQVIDLNSLNGVHVNGKRVTHATLHHQDKLRVGGFTFEVQLPGSPRVTEVTDQVTSLDPQPRVQLPPGPDSKRKVS